MMAPFDPVQTPLDRGTTLIEASAGTGKTYTITAIVLRLLLEQELEIGQILVTTYTDAATAELRDRLRLRLSSALSAFVQRKSDDPLIQPLLGRQDPDRARRLLERALRNFDEACVYTIHGFCQRMLKERAFESGLLFDAELLKDQGPLLQELVEDYWRGHYAGAPSIIGSLTIGTDLSADTFRELLRGVINRPMLSVIPALDETVFDSIKVEVRSLYDSLRAHWKSDGDSIGSALLGPPRWARANTKHGKPETVQEWLDSARQCFSGSSAPAESFGVLENFAQSKLERARLTNAQSPRHEFFALCERYGTIPGRFSQAAKAHFLGWAQRELKRRKIRRNVLCFEDLLTRLHEALVRPEGEKLAVLLRDRFQAALIDEFQDTDGTQEAIFQRIFGPGEGWLYLIGDPKQAIYGFRGADVFTYLNAASSAQQRYTLKTNWRSESALVGAINHLFGREPGAFVFDGIAAEPVAAAGEKDQKPFRIGDTPEPPLKLWHWDAPDPIKSRDAHRELPRATAAAIARLLASDARVGTETLVPSQIAVLVATHVQARAVQEALHTFCIPSVLVSDQRVWFTKEARELHTVLAAIAEPVKEPLIRAALVTELFGITVSQLDAMNRAENEWERLLGRFTRYRDRWLRAGFIQMFRAFLQGERVRSRLLALADGDRRMTNLLHLSELLERASSERRLGPAALLRWFCEQRAGTSGPQDDEAILRLERDDAAVQIVTMHKSKGLEYEVVFCPFVWGKAEHPQHKELLVFHDPRNNNRLTLDLGTSDEATHKALLAREKLAEHVRLLYVALTRAMHQCHFVWGRFNRCEVSALAWLLHRPPVAEENVAECLKSHMKELTCDCVTSDLKKLCADAPESFHVLPLPECEGPRYTPASETTGEHGNARPFRGTIARDWCVSSFTSLTENSNPELPDYDLGVLADALGQLVETPEGIHAFPAGARAGLCLHEILEELDFTQPSSVTPLVARKLEAFSYDPGEWGGIVTEGISRLLRTPLEAGFCLEEIPMHSRLTELEFYLPAARLDSIRLRSLLGDIVSEHLEFDPRRGWLKGYIDLVVEHQGRFYIFDWKSNRLGTDPAAYGQPDLERAMAQHHYPLQLHIYAVALHRYLASRMPGYRYEKHFGGVYYVFLRGVDPAQPDRGIYRYCPEGSTICALSAWLEGAK